MMNRELISVIVPIYNGEKYVDNCFMQISSQTYSQLEIIFVDDGSSDTTLDKLILLSKMDERVIIISQDNMGAAAARNSGIVAANGKYIVFVDADDYVFPEYVEDLYRNLIEYDADVSIANYVKALPNETIKNSRNEIVMQFTGIEAAKNMLYRKGINGYPVNKLIKSSIIKNIKFKEKVIYGEDGIFVYEMFLNANTVVYTTKVLYIYYQQENSVNHMIRKNDIYYSWRESYNSYLLSENTSRYNLLRAASCKMFVLTTDFYCRLHNLEDFDCEKKELLRCIGNCCGTVKSDKNAKITNRIMAIVCDVNLTLFIGICILGKRIIEIFHIRLRHSL